MTSNPADQAAPEPPGPGPRRRRERRGRKAALALFVLATGGAVTVATLGIGGESAGGEAASELPPKSVKVTKQTLKDSKSEDGELGYGPTAIAASRLPGTLTAVPTAGAEVTRGKELFAVDNQPVTLMYGSMPAYRALKTGTEGKDVKQLEANLAALGYSGFTVDREYSGKTAVAVKEWQEDLGLKETGTVDLGRVVFASAAVRVDSVTAAKGDTTGPGQKVLTYAGTTKVVTVDLDPADQRLAKKGSTVSVRLPDDSLVEGTIDKVSTVIEAGEDEQKEAKTKIELVVKLKGAKAEKAAEAYALAAVHVDFTAGERKDVLTVPVAALLALAEGGFGVEVVEGSKSKYVPVTTGLFADGRVEISGQGIAESTKVGMPK